LHVALIAIVVFLTAAITNASGVKLVRLGWSMLGSIVGRIIGCKYPRSDPLMLSDNVNFTL